MKTPKSKSPNQKPKFKKIALVSVVIVITLLVAAQVVFDVVATRRLQRGSDGAIVNLIIAAVENLSRPAIQDGPTGKVYIPEAHLVFPPYANSLVAIRYNYSPGFDKTPAELMVTKQNTLSSAESRLWAAYTSNSWWAKNDPQAVFKEVPNLQTCERGIHLLFEPATDVNLRQVSSKALNDGRTLYIYHELQTCKNEYDQQGFIDYLKQAQSY